MGSQPQPLHLLGYGRLLHPPPSLAVTPGLWLLSMGPNSSPRPSETPGLLWIHQSLAVDLLGLQTFSGPWPCSWVSETFKVHGPADTHPSWAPDRGLPTSGLEAPGPDPWAAFLQSLDYYVLPLPLSRL